MKRMTKSPNRSQLRGINQPRSSNFKRSFTWMLTLVALVVDHSSPITRKPLLTGLVLDPNWTPSLLQLSHFLRL